MIQIWKTEILKNNKPFKQSEEWNNLRIIDKSLVEDYHKLLEDLLRKKYKSELKEDDVISIAFDYRVVDSTHDMARKIFEDVYKQKYGEKIW